MQHTARYAFTFRNLNDLDYLLTSGTARVYASDAGSLIVILLDENFTNGLCMEVTARASKIMAAPIGATRPE